MCGIAGIFSLGEAPVLNGLARIRRMNRLLLHRGPDDQAVYRSPDERLVLGNTRLAIVDPLSLCHQPLESSDRSGVISFNGEIYNYLDLMGLLQDKGRRFRSRMDTEVLLEGLCQEGDDFLGRLDGMWAFAFYELQAKRLLLSRDLMGERHLFFFHDSVAQELLFASEVEAILAGAQPPHRFETDFASFLTSLQFFAPAPGKTMVQGIRRLLPGCNLIVTSDGALVEKRHRQLQPQKWADFFSRDPSTPEVFELFEEKLSLAVRSRLPAEVPFYCTLSGGLDSSAICLYASEFGSKKISTLFGQSTEEPLKKDGDALNEWQASEFTAKRLGADHHHISLDAGDSIPILQRLASTAYEGMFDSGTAAFEMLGHHVRQSGKKVIIISEGPDEFLGYPKDLRYFLLDRQKAAHPRAFGLWQQLSAHPGCRGMIHRLAPQANLVPPFFSERPLRFPPINESWDYDQLSDFLSQEQFQQIGAPYGTLPGPYAQMDGAYDTTQLRALSYAVTSLPDMYNLRADKAFLRASVEARLPFQAVGLAEFMIAMPASLRFGQGQTTKHALREVVKKHLGPAIANRKKYGFAAPIWKSRKIFPSMHYAETILASSIFQDFPLSKKLKSITEQARHEDWLWPLFVLARTSASLKDGAWGRNREVRY